MKKKIIIIAAIILVITAAITSFILIKKEKDKEIEETNKHLTLIENFDDFKKMIENKEDFILIITGTECHFCEEYLPTFKKVLRDYDLNAYQINQDTLEPEEIGFLKNIASINGTPTVIFIKDGEEETTTHRIVGNRSRSYTIEKLEQFGIID